MTGFGGLHWLLAAPITLAAAFGMGLHHALFGLLVVLMARRSNVGNRRPLLMAPVFWVAIEFFRDRITGFPWNLLGGSQVDNIPFARICPDHGRLRVIVCRDAGELRACGGATALWPTSARTC